MNCLAMEDLPEVSADDDRTVAMRKVPRVKRPPIRLSDYDLLQHTTKKQKRRCAYPGQRKIFLKFSRSANHDVERFYLRQFLEEEDFQEECSRYRHYKGFDRLKARVADYIFHRHLSSSWYLNTNKETTTRLHNSSAACTRTIYFPRQLADRFCSSDGSAIPAGTQGIHWACGLAELYDLIFQYGAFALCKHGLQIAILDPDTFRLDRDADFAGARIAFVAYHAPTLPRQPSETETSCSISSPRNLDAVDSWSRSSGGHDARIMLSPSTASTSTTCTDNQQITQSPRTLSSSCSCSDVVSMSVTTAAASPTPKARQEAQPAVRRKSRKGQLIVTRVTSTKKNGQGVLSDTAASRTDERNNVGPVVKQEPNPMRSSHGGTSLSTRRPEKGSSSKTFAKNKSQAVSQDSKPSATPRELNPASATTGSPVVPPETTSAPANTESDPIVYSQAEEHNMIRQYLQSIGFDLKQRKIGDYIAQLHDLGFDPHCASSLKMTKKDLTFMAPLHQRLLFDALFDAKLKKDEEPTA